MAPSRPIITITKESSLIPNFMAVSSVSEPSCRHNAAAAPRPSAGPVGASRRTVHLDRGGAGVGVDRVHDLGGGVEHHLDLELAERLLGPAVAGVGGGLVALLAG